MESQQSDRLHKYTVCDVANFSPTEISFFYLLEKNKNFIALQQQQQQQQRWTKIKWDSIPVWIIYLVEWLHGDALEKKSKKNRTHSSATSCLKLQCQMTALNGTSDAFRAMTCWIWIWSFFLSIFQSNIATGHVATIQFVIIVKFFQSNQCFELNNMQSTAHFLTQTHMAMLTACEHQKSLIYFDLMDFGALELLYCT